MKLTFVRAESEADRRLHPIGHYWYAQTDNGDYDAVAEDPLTAVSQLAVELECALLEGI